MKKIALINQRYGTEVNGGSEYYTRLLAKQLMRQNQVEILTTTALSYDTWENYYPQGTECMEDITVRRFSVKKPRNVRKQRISGKLMSALKWKFKWINTMWIKAQGPDCPELIQYISEHKADYDLFIFVTYLYYTTVCGMPKVSEKAIFIPTAHDEYCIYFKIYEKLFHMPKGIVFLTEEERDFVQKTFHNEEVPYIVAGTGIDVPQDIEPNRFCRKYGIEKKYLIYAGRVDENKGCKDMFEAFFAYRSEVSHDRDRLELVVLGQKFMEIPQEADIHYLGFVSERDKFDAIAGAEALWLPSGYESLSISVLEAMAIGKPVLVNGKCEVLKGHCVKSGGGFHYEDIRQAVQYLKWFSDKEEHLSEYEAMSRKACVYIKENYSWEKIMDSFQKLTEMI